MLQPYDKQQTQIKKFLTGLIGMVFLFYVVSCGGGTSPSGEVVIDSGSIRSLTLKEVTKDSIAIEWSLLKTKEGVVDDEVFYTVYAETNDGGNGKVFVKDEATNIITHSILALANPDEDDDKWGIEISDLKENTPYRIVVEAREPSGSISRSHLLAYTASSLSDDPDVAGVEVSTLPENEEVTVTWDPKEGAQAYALQVIKNENLLEENNVPTTEDIITVICIPRYSLLCEAEDQFAQENQGKLIYTFRVNEKRPRYQLAIAPFNFQDLEGLQAVDEEGNEKSFTEEVLVKIREEGSQVSSRLQTALEKNSQKVQIKVQNAGPPVDLVLESTGSTVSASWGHGEGAEYYYAIITSNEGVHSLTNIIDREDPSGNFIGGGYTSFTNLTANTSHTVTVQSVTVFDSTNNVGGKVSAKISTKDAEYWKPSAPRDLRVDFSRGSFTKINNRLYATGYPLTYTKADTLVEAGGLLEDVSYHYRYRVEGGEWVGYSESTNGDMLSLQVEDLSDAATIKAGYGKEYHVEVIASNHGGFVSEAATLGFTYKSFPEPFIQSENLTVVPGDRKLTVTWPAVTEVNGSTVAGYTVVLSENLYASPNNMQSINTVKREVVFGGLKNNHPYIITVIPNGVDTDNILTALSLATEYKFGENTEYEIVEAIVKGSEEEIIFTNYTGAPEYHTPQGAPEAVVNLEVTVGKGLVTVTWEKATEGSPATGYVLEYLADVKTPINDADAELGELDWTGAVSNNVVTNDSGSYSEVISGLNITSATNVFRVKAVRIDGENTESGYRYYVLRATPPQLLGAVGELVFSDYDQNGSFKVSWSKPSGPWKYKDGTSAILVGYKVSWETNAEADGGSDEITDPDTLSYTITGLTPGILYYVKVQAKYDNEGKDIDNPISSKATYTVKGPEDVVASSIIYSEPKTGGFKVKWDKVSDKGYGPEGKLTTIRYRLELSSDQGVTWVYIPSTSTSTEHVFTDLIPGNKYRVRIKTYNNILYSSKLINLSGNFVEGEDTWALSSPGPVVGLAVSVPSYNGAADKGGFTVSWAAPTDTGISADGTDAAITGYEVAYAVVSNDVVGEYTSVTHEGTATTHVLANLNPHAEYDIRIQAQTTAGVGIGSHISGWVPSLPSAVDSDSILFTLPTAHIIRIEWAAPKAGKAGGSVSNNTPTLYKVEISTEGGEYSTLKDDHPGISFFATNLDQSTEYRARITAKNTWGKAKASVSTSTGTTAEIDATRPSAVGNLRVDSFTASQVVLSWTAPDNKGTTDGTSTATLTSYIVKYKTADNAFIEITEESEGVRLTGTLTGTSTNVTVTGLAGNTAYTFLVVAVNSGNAVGLDEDAPRKEQVTKIATPENLRQSQCAKSTSVDLAWDIVSGATSYKIYRDNTEIGGSIVNSYTDTSLTPGTTYTYKVRACNGTDCSDDSDSREITTLNDKILKDIINSENIPTDLGGYDQRSRDIFSRYAGGSTSTPLVARYLKPDGTGNGSSFDKAAGNLKTVLEGITDASASKVYAVLLTGGNYKAGSQMAMKNHVAIIGGVDECLGSSDTITALDGEGAYRVFNNNMSLDNTALLYGVTVTNGKAENGGGMQNHNGSSPSLFKVTFSGNTANNFGGGMYNNNYSSPSLSHVTFSGNTANIFGGGMYNYSSSSPRLEGVTFSENKASSGGGMYNGAFSSPTLVGVTFSSNTADKGGGMYNIETDLLIINGIFWGNTASSLGPQFYFNNNRNQGNLHTYNLRIYNSIVERGTGTLESGTSYNTSTSQGGFAIDGGDNPIVISFSNIITNDPGLGALANNGGSVLTHTIPSGSSAVDQGLYVKKSGTTLYYSDDNTDWYTSPDLSGDKVTVPAGAEDLTATDATGYDRTNRPDLGAYEYR